MSGKKTKAARKKEREGMTEEQKLANIIAQGCDYYGRILRGLTVDKAFPVIGDITCKTLFWLEAIAKVPHAFFVREFGKMLIDIANVEAEKNELPTVISPSAVVDVTPEPSIEDAEVEPEPALTADSSSESNPD